MRCIEADKLIMKDLGDGNYLITPEAIINAPTFEAEPVKYGHYIEEVVNGGMRRITSCCNDDQTKLTTWYTPKYCPNCGAKIELKEED